MRSTSILLLLTFAFFALASRPAVANIRTYFNQRQGVSYVDPLRNITRGGDNLEAVLLAEISKARRSIDIAVQEIRLPAVAMELVRKQRAGVEVRLLLENGYNHDVASRPSSRPSQQPENEDPDGTYDGARRRELIALVDVDRDGRLSLTEMEARDAVFILRQARIPIKDDTSDGSMGSGLMHHKFVVIDGKTTVVTSANFTPSCIHGDLLVPGSRGNANAMMVVESAPMARAFTDEFNEMWGGRFGARKRYRGVTSFEVRGKRIQLQFSPSPRIIDWTMTTNGLIGKTLASARDTLHAALFVFSEQRLADSMQSVQDRAAIGVLVDPRFAFRPYSEVLDLLGVGLPTMQDCRLESGNNPWRAPLSRAGVPSLSSGDVLHHKFGVVDGRKLIFGSHNWSDAANTTNDEFTLIVEDATAAAAFDQEYARLASRARWGLPNTVTREIDHVMSDCDRR
jgi:phosphatidylserine/phosphatidylglycerophosphate/cardiolipin synthase-like enzyme